jgi:hypothetical protein
MSYKVFIQVGKTKVGSIALPNKKRVALYVKRTPVGNNNTKVVVTNLRNGKVFTGSKIRFYHPKWW